MNAVNIYLKIVVLFSLVLNFIACGSDSGSNAVQSKSPHVGLTYETLDDLETDKSCDETIVNVVAYVKTDGLNYICDFDSISTLWEWTSGQNEKNQTQNTNQIVPYSSSSLMIAKISSSSQTVFTSSNSLISLTELAGKSCLNNYYKESEYASDALKGEGMIISIEGTLSNLRCTKVAENIFIWKIVENGNLTTKSSSSVSSSSFVFGEFIDPRDGQTYQTIGVRKNIGSDEEVEEIWFAEDLKYKCSSEPCLYTWQTALKSTMVSGDICDIAWGDKQGLCPDGWLIQRIGPEIFAVEDFIKAEFHEYGAGYWDGRWATETAAVNWIASEFIGGTYTSFYGDCDNGFITGICNGNESSVEGNGFDEEFRIRCVKYEKIPSTMSIVDVCDIVKSYGEYWVDYDQCKMLNADSELKDLRCRCKT